MFLFDVLMGFRSREDSLRSEFRLGVDGDPELSAYLLMSGLIIHQDDLPELSFWTRMKRLCKDKLCLIEFFWGLKKK